MTTSTILRILPLTLALIAGSVAAQSPEATNPTAPQPIVPNIHLVPVPSPAASDAGTAPPSYSGPQFQVFGVVDLAARYGNTKNVGHVWSLASGSYSSSRFGFRGEQDIGSGRSISFWLESFLTADTGTTTPAGFQRRSTLSFVDNKWGEIRAGRDYTPTHTNWARFDPFGYVGIGSVQLLILSATGKTPVTAAFGSNPNDVQRANNGIQLILPKNPWNIEGNVVHTFGEGGTSANDQHKGDGGHLGFTWNGLTLSGATLRTFDTSATNGFRDSAIGGAYALPWVRLSGGERRLTYLHSRQDTFLAAAQFFIGVHEIKMSWNRAEELGSVATTKISGDATNQYALGYVYNFTKKSRFYATAALMKNKGNARFVLPGAPAATSGGLSSQGIEAGINQEF
jgi:predicted porin